MSESVKPVRRRGVESVDVAGEILRALLGFQGGARLKDIEKATGITSATLHRYLISLIRCGLVRRAEGSNRYDFGLLAYQIGQVASHGNSVVSLVAPLLEEFSEEIGETSAIGIWLDSGATMARWFEANSSITIALKPGVHVPLTRSSTGKVFAAYLPREKTASLIKAEFAERGCLTDSQLEDFEAEMQEIRRTGICQVRSGHIKGIASVSVPVFDYTENIVAVLAVVTNETTFDRESTARIEVALRTFASRVSSLLGAPATSGHST